MWGKNRDRIPMEVVQIDEGWHRSRYDWRENGKFSMGMDSIARCIRKAGMVPGVWLCPVNPEVMPFEAGSPRRVFPAEWYINYGTGEPSMTRLDPTQPEARAHMRKVLQTLYDQGYRYFKLDFSYIPNDSRSFYNPKVTRLQAQRALFRLYREAIGEESYLMACCYQQRTIVRMPTPTASEPTAVRKRASAARWQATGCRATYGVPISRSCQWRAAAMKTASSATAIRTSPTWLIRTKPNRHSCSPSTVSSERWAVRC